MESAGLKQEAYYIPQKLLNMKQVKVNVIGVGGTGSHIIDFLAPLSYGLMHRSDKNLSVVAYDFDLVKDKNVGRSDFVRGDVGMDKNMIAINKANLGFGFNWRYEHPDRFEEAPINIFCLDSVDARKDYLQQITSMKTFDFHNEFQLLFDIGNDRDFGQVVMTDRERELVGLPPTNKTSEDIGTESCSDLDWYVSQDLFINKTMAMWTAQMIWQLFTAYQLDYNQLFWNSKLMTVSTKLVKNGKNKVSDQRSGLAV